MTPSQQYLRGWVLGVLYGGLGTLIFMSVWGGCA